MIDRTDDCLTGLRKRQESYAKKKPINLISLSHRGNLSNSMGPVPVQHIKPTLSLTTVSFRLSVSNKDPVPYSNFLGWNI